MAQTARYKNNRGERQATVDTTFNSGMSFSNGTIEEGFVKTLVNFDFAEDKKVLVPRAGMRVCEFVFPDMNTPLVDEDLLLDENVCIKDMRECVENGVTYRQCILGLPDSEDITKGKIWVATFRKNEESITDLQVGDEIIDLDLSDCIFNGNSIDCVYYGANLQEIHGVKLRQDARIGFPVGSFAFGNSYYFFALVDGDSVLYRTKFQPSIDSNIGGFYVFEEVDIKTLTASEAVQFGYNMLSDNPYSFKNEEGSSVIILTGILPYLSSDSEAPLVMTPKKNQKLFYRTYYSGTMGQTYRFLYEWRTLSEDEWNTIGEETFVLALDKPAEMAFEAPNEEIMIRVSAYNVNGETPETPEHAMTVGFDFSINEHGTTSNLEQKNYDLGTASGMTVWKNRLVLWGVTEDPTVMFVSDLNEPAYFPYPNNITVFDNPIISVLEFMDKLIVFTTDKCYQVALSETGDSWISTVIQANLHIDMWDKHLIQAVRNMIYFKSGNYYYMIVPKAQSTTGELTLAPISNSMTEFFNHFMVNVEGVFKDTYGEVFPHNNDVARYDLITYFNYLDYEDVHNLYVFAWNGNSDLIHFDIIYNTVSRHWRISILEKPQILYPFRHDATQTGIFATTSVVYVKALNGTSQKRIIQLYKANPLFVKDFFIPPVYDMLYTNDSDFYGVLLVDDGLIFPDNSGDIDGDNFNIYDIVIDSNTNLDEGILGLLGSTSYISGFKISVLADNLKYLIEHYDEFFIFRNYQFVDTGYRADNVHLYKRYRELQLQVNSVDGKDMQFGTEFYIDGDIRKSIYCYNPPQIIEEMTPGFATAYIEPYAYIDVDSELIDKSNLWTIEQHLYPEVNLWRIRIALSGKGAAPRLKLCSRNEVRYQLLGLNWIYRIMNMR